MSEIDTFPVLYILMRTDLDSMNAGKGMAQASHAANAFWKRMNDMFLAAQSEDKAVWTTNTPAMDLANKWQLETGQGFGTVLVLGVTENEMRTAVTIADKLGFVADVIHDPTYPLRDGDCCHFLPLDTCGYVFGDKNDTLLSAVLGNFPLHP